jgi:hypothetical protein
MPTACAGLTANVLNNCENPITGGANDRIWLVNKADIASTTPDPLNPYLITGFTINSGAFLYVYEGQNNSVDLRAALVRQRYTTVYDHEVIFKVFDNTPEVKQQLAYLGQGVVVAIVEKNFKASDGLGAFEMYGLDAGLILNANESNASDADTQGAWNLTISTSEQAKEPGPPKTLLISSTYAATKAALEALQAP